MTLDVLIVDDNYADRLARGFSEYFGKWAKFVPATSCDEAIQQLAQQRYDAIILDYNMFPKNGLQTAKDIRVVDVNVKLVGYSVAWDSKNATEADLKMYTSEPEPIIRFLITELIRKEKSRRHKK